MPQCLVYSGGFYGSGVAADDWGWSASIQCAAGHRVARVYGVHCELDRGIAVLQEMPVSEAGPGAPLLDV
jgi:hypothetical protein